MPKPIQRVKFKKAIARHTKIRDQNPSLGYIVQVNLMSVAPTNRNLRIVHKKREWQEQGAREAAWKLAKKCVKIKGAWKSNILLIFGKWVFACI